MKQPKKLTRKQKIKKGRNPTQYSELRYLKKGDMFQTTTGEEIFEKITDDTVICVGYEASNYMKPETMVRVISDKWTL